MHPRGPRQAFIESLNKKLLKEEVIIPIVLFIDNVFLTVNNEKVPDISLEDFIICLHKNLVSIEPKKVFVNRFDELDNLVNTLNLCQRPDLIISAFEHVITLPVNHQHLKLGIWSTNSPFINFYLDCLKNSTTHLAELLIGRVTQNLVFQAPLPQMPQQPVTSAFPNSSSQLPSIQAFMPTYPQTVQAHASAPLSLYPAYHAPVQAPLLNVHASTFTRMPPQLTQAAPVQKATSSAQQQEKEVINKSLELANLTKLLALAPKPKPKPTPKKNKETIKDEYDKAISNGLKIFVPKLVSSQEKKRSLEADIDLQNNKVEEQTSQKKPRTSAEPENKPPVAPSEKVEDFPDNFASFSNDLFADSLYDLSQPQGLNFADDEDSLYQQPYGYDNNSPFQFFSEHQENENDMDQTTFKPQDNW